MSESVLRELRALIDVDLDSVLADSKDQEYVGLIKARAHVVRALRQCQEQAQADSSEVFADRYVVRVTWHNRPLPLFKMRCYGLFGQRQWLDTKSWTADQLRVKAREMVAEALRVDPVDCPTNVDVYYEQAAVKRLCQREEAP